MRTKFTKYLGILALCIIGVNSSLAQWVNNQAADAVYGQDSFTTMTIGNASNDNLVRPVSVAFTKNNKKVIIGTVTTVNSKSALYIYEDYTNLNNTKLAVVDKIILPERGVVNSVFVDEDDNLWVATNGSYGDDLYKYTNASSLTSSSTATATFKLKKYDASLAEYTNFKGSVFVKSGVLVIADATNHIVARYNVRDLTSSGTKQPIAYIGAVAANNPVYGHYDTPSSKVRLNKPVQVSIDKNNALWIADALNFRVLKFDDGLSFTDSSTPSVTMGRTSYKNSTGNDNNANNFVNLTGIATDNGDRLYVAATQSYTGSKVNIYNTNTITNNANANAINVIGYNLLDDNYPIHGSNGYAANRLFDTSNIAVNEYLWVTDYSWHRVTRFAPNTALPVTFSDLKATKVDDMINLSWKTSAETNNSHFMVSTSYDGKTFSKVKQVDARATPGDYHVSFPIENTLYAGLGLLGLLLIPRQRNKWMKMVMLLLGVCFLVACAKDKIEAETQEKEVVYVKLEQVDLDGTVTELGVKSLKIK
ncbi:two-component regulator propeller domain-containing protein [Pedobacter sp. UBA4863]|uniref:two-component regulator propeller domain-containing protein n=1 Tax=Pedobacter sp. UBA4863 TaxID=1947060 RepID=UPI0025E33A35|nr:two-component regulator propeller domain-containing protein [Pedobacter sp. UBA4863]